MTPALHEPLSPPVDDDTRVPAAISLILPRELVERILLLLDTKSILKCRLLNGEFNAIIQSSISVQYYLTCRAAGVIDNPQSLLSYAERLKALGAREDAWRKLTPVFETTIQVIDQPSTWYDLTAGKYFRSDKDRKDLYYCHLPSSPQDNPQWIRIQGHGPGQSYSGFIVDTGMAIYEHDLIVNVISSEVENQAEMQRYSLDLVHLKLSIGEYHPLARHPLIHVQISPSAQPYTTIRIVGDNLALIVHDEGGSKLFIFDWKTGHKRLQHIVSENAYEGSIPIFVSLQLLLVPNCFLAHFEVWHLFPSCQDSNPPAQILCFKIPTVSDNFPIVCIQCHGEFSPFLHSRPLYFSSRPFFPSSENSIIIANLRFGLRRAYKLIMHRRELLDMIQKWTSPLVLEEHEGLPTWLTSEVTVHKIVDPDDGSVRLGAQSELVSAMSHQGPSPRSRDSPTLSQLSPISLTSRYNTLQVKWANWGPPVSRWFQVNGIHKWWINQSTGQRYAFLSPSSRDKRKSMVGVADFNLHNIRRHAQTMVQLRGEGEDPCSNGNTREGKKEDDEEELEILDHEGVFSEEVYMGLKCVIDHALGEYDFDGVLMDEERLLGLKLSDKHRTASIKVLYFG